MSRSVLPDFAGWEIKFAEALAHVFSQAYRKGKTRKSALGGQLAEYLGVDLQDRGRIGGSMPLPLILLKNAVDQNAVMWDY